MLAKYKIFLLWILLLITFAFVVFFVLFKSVSGFINGIDGERRNSNYHELTANYSMLKGENSICEFKKNIPVRVIPNVDSINWDSEFIVGYYRGKYFIIVDKNQSVKTYNSKEKLIQKLEYLPTNSLEHIPSLHW